MWELYKGKAPKSIETAEKVTALYKSGLSIRQIAEQLNYSYTAVRYHVVKAGIARTISEAMAVRKKESKNDTKTNKKKRPRDRRKKMKDFEATLVWTARCRCGRVESASPVIQSWIGIWDEEDLDSENAVADLEEKGWTFKRITYEELTPICPECTSPSK